MLADPYLDPLVPFRKKTRVLVRSARVEESHDRWMWVRWAYVWEAPEPGSYRLMARATDEHGRVQPQTKPNFQRKHFDGIVPTEIDID